MPAGYEATTSTCHQSIFRAVLLHVPCQVSLPSTPPRRPTASSSCASPSSHNKLRICTTPRRQDPSPSVCRMKHRSTKESVLWSLDHVCTSKNDAPKGGTTPERRRHPIIRFRVSPGGFRVSPGVARAVKDQARVESRRICPAADESHPPPCRRQTSDQGPRLGIDPAAPPQTDPAAPPRTDPVTPPPSLAAATHESS